MLVPAHQRRMLLLFVLAVFVRASFWLATPDRSGAFAAAYQGDAPVWCNFVNHAADDIEWSIPFRPPGMAWLTDLLTDGSSFVLARLVLLLLGALVAPLVYAAARQTFAESVAFVAGLICAASSALVLLSSGLHSETPYLVLFVLSVGDHQRLRTRPGTAVAVRWALLQAAACLLRADHLVFVVLALGWLVVRRTPQWPRSVLTAMATMGLALLPWQWHAAQQIARANTDGFPGHAPAALPLPGALPWDPDALRGLDRMPAFARTMAFRFVDDTMRARGAKQVAANDLGVLVEAYDSTPEPLSTPLLVLYGPLNFFLANGPESSGGFTRDALDRPPPLAGGPARYPRGLLQALPRNGPLRWDYPPHLDAINHGYRLGLTWIAAEPGRALVLIGNKLLQAWRGAATGFGSYALPFGMSGVREPVDLVVADGAIATGWRLLLLGLTILGLWRARRTAGAAPWLCWLVAKVITIALFFGYARLGALCVPSLAMLWALAIDRPWPRSRLLAWLPLTVFCGLEIVRCVRAPLAVVEQQGRATGGTEQHERVHVSYR